jgi:hypothetical protein
MPLCVKLITATERCGINKVNQPTRGSSDTKTERPVSSERTSTGFPDVFCKKANNHQRKRAKRNQKCIGRFSHKAIVIRYGFMASLLASRINNAHDDQPRDMKEYYVEPERSTDVAIEARGDRQNLSGSRSVIRLTRFCTLRSKARHLFPAARLFKLGCCKRNNCVASNKGLQI